MKSKLLGLFLLAASPVLAGGHFFFGIGGGRPYYGGPRYYARPPIVTYVAPRPVYTYGNGYYDNGYEDTGYYGNGYGYSSYYGRPLTQALFGSPRVFTGAVTLTATGVIGRLR